MAFNFGAPAPTPATSGDASGGSAAASAASGSSTGGGFTFGASAAGTTFGASQTPLTAAQPTTAAPAAGVFNLGGNASEPTTAFTAAPAAGLASASTPAPSTTAPAPTATGGAAPTAGGFSFASPPTATSSASSNATSATVPEFETVFPNTKILSKLESLLPTASESSGEGRLAAQELIHVLQCNPECFGSQLAKPQAFVFKAKDVALRERLKTHPHVTLHGQTTGLTPVMLNEIFELADELRISELEAMALYDVACMPETRARLQDQVKKSFVDNVLTGSIHPLELGNDVIRAARELYFYERSCALKAVHLLIQSRLEQNTAIIAASDQLLNANLLGNLVGLVREWTRLADELERELNKPSTPAQNTFGFLRPPSSDNTEETRFAKVLLAFAYGERQVASECLFFLTYHTQCTADEVASLIDLVKDLTNGTSETTGLPLLDPIRDVPSAFYDPAPANVNPWGAPFTSALPPLREKNPVEWEEELVKEVWKQGGKPQLLQCVSTLVLSVVCAMDSRHELIDRNTHAINVFGTGNALFPPQSNETAQLNPIHIRLDPRADSRKDWKRKDIWGLLVASYALLLRSLPSVANSPRLGSTSPASSLPRQGPVDVKSTWRASMVTPTETKSFTFARLCLMPSFQRHKETLDAKCDTYEFFMYVLSDFISHYLDVLCASGDVPISRAQWERNEERELQLRREQQEQQRQFRAWSGTSSNDEEEIPSVVDLMARPDCLDDVVAVAIALCWAGPCYARSFWSTAEEEVDESVRTALVPSRALRKLEIQQESDGTLLPIYVSFLAALALAPAAEDGTESGATLVNTLLSRTAPENEKNPVTWATLMEAIRWYARELTPGDYSVVKSTTESKSTTQGLAGSGSTAYYYGAEGNGYEGPAGYDSSQQTTSSASSTAASKPKELGEINTNILLSHLGIIAAVVSKSSAARSALVSMNLPIVGQNSSSIAGEDPVLTVLFLLGIAPLTPMVRGAVFSTIASLLDLEGATTEERKIIQEQANKGWELLETCRVVPISLLDQYESLPEGAAQLSQGLAFPPSSLSLVSSETKGAWLPPEQKYGIVFELEHIESRLGQYPSSEGFLQLLTNLFIAGGFPSELGRGSRPRPGCTPYIEYVIHFILPRALGFKKDSAPLPFRSTTDKSRLVSRGLEAIEAVLVRYTVPPPVPSSSVPSLVDEKNNQRLAISEASEMFGLSTLVEQIVIAPSEKDAAGFAHDYRDEVTTPEENAISSSTSSGQTESRIRGARPSVPCSKSPGFTVLAELLSSSMGTLFIALVKVLTNDGAERGIRSLCGVKGHMHLISLALFGQTHPTVSSARAKGNDTSQPLSFTSLLKPLLPPLEAFAMDRDNAVYWRETSIILALRILCAGAAREEAFFRAVSTRQTLLSLVPVLRFQPRSFPPSCIVKRDVQVSRLVDLLISFGSGGIQQGDRIETLPVVVQYLQCEASSIDHDAKIASPALALTLYVGRSLGANDSIRALCGTGKNGRARFAEAMGRRLSRSSKRAASPVDASIASLILDSILTTFREGSAQEVSLSHVILGLPFQTREGSWVNGTYETVYHFSGDESVVRDCFDALLNCLSETAFMTDPHSSNLAARCFEIMYRLTEIRGGGVAAVGRTNYVTQRLGSTSFWTTNLMRLLASHSDGGESPLQILGSFPPAYRPTGIENTLHCIAWLLKSASNELLAMNHGHRRQLLSVLFSSPYQLLTNVLVFMPISNDRADNLISLGAPPSMETLASARTSMTGAVEVVDGYMLLDQAKLSHQLVSAGNQKEREIWAELWNATILWNCASSHLSAAALYLIESAITSSRSAAGEVMGSPGVSFEAFELHQPAKLLELTLLRLLHGAERGRLSRMDNRILPNVSYNLSRIVLLLTEQLALSSASFNAANMSIEGSTIEICRLLIQSILSSSSIDLGHPLLPREKLRTAIFGLSLSIMMTSESNRTSLYGMMNQFGEAAISIAQIATSRGLSGDSLASEGNNAATLAQIALISVLGLNRDEEQFSVVSLLTVPSDPGGTRTVIHSVLALIEALDDQICHVVKKIAACRRGPELLLNAGLPQTLRRAATNYAMEEQKIMADFRYRNVSLDVPAFLQGHISLLKALLLSPLLPTNRGRQLASDAVDVLLEYSAVFQRMFSSFPRNAQSLLGCLQCQLLAVENGGLERFVSDERSTGWDAAVLQLCYHLSQNPFPRRFLPLLPHKLIESRRNILISGIVSVSDSNENDTSWWDEIEKGTQKGMGSASVVFSGPPSGRAQDFGLYANASPVVGAPEDQWTVPMYDAALMGAEELDACLSYLVSRVAFSPLPSLDGHALARGLCRCSDAAKGTRFRLEHIENDLSQTTSSTGNMDITWSDPVARKQKQLLEKQYLTKLGKLMQRCSENLLVILSMHLRTLLRLRKNENEKERNFGLHFTLVDFSESVLAALDYTRIESMGFGCRYSGEASASNDETVIQIAKSLRTLAMDCRPVS